MAIKKTSGQFTSFDGTSIYYEVRGEGAPIVLAYGLACQMNHWHHQTHYFSENYKTITFDYRGHHKSGTPNDDSELNLRAIAQDIKGLLDHLDIKNATFFGHSLGVQVLVKAHELFPEIFSRLVLLNGFASNPLQGMWGFQSSKQLITYIQELNAKYPYWVEMIWKASLLNPLTIPLSALAGGFNMNLTAKKDIEIYTKGVSLIEFNVFLTLFENMMNYDGLEVLGAVKCPTLIISGDKDTVSPLRCQLQMKERIPQAELLKVPYGSHCTQLDYPDFVNLKIDHFLKAHSA